jgi:nucleolar protein 12
VFADIEKKKKKQEKKEGNKAFLGFKKAKELLAASLKVFIIIISSQEISYFLNLEKSRRISRKRRAREKEDKEIN